VVVVVNMSPSGAIGALAALPTCWGGARSSFGWSGRWSR
jgi:hypothetical protein